MLKHVRASEDWNDKDIKQKGFTLIELLVVIIILGVLAAIVVLAVNGLSSRGTRNACLTEKRAVETAAAAYYSDHSNSYPLNAQAMDPTYLRDPDFNWTFAADGEATGKTC